MRSEVRAGVRLATVVARFAVRGHIVRVDVEASGGGRVVDLLRTTRGRSAAHGVGPVTYAWSRAVGPLPAVDGPWYYAAPEGSFTVHAGTVTHLGTTALSIRG